MRRKAGLLLAQARFRVDGGGVLTRCRAQPREQIFDIPGLSRGGRGLKSDISPSPGLDWLSASGGGDQQTGPGGRSREGQPRVDTRLPPRGSAGCPKSLEAVFPIPSRPPCPGANHFRPRRLNLYPSSGEGLQCGFSVQGLGGSLYSGLFLCPKVGTQRPACPKSGGEAPACFRLGLGSPISLFPPGWSPFFTLHSYSVSQSHKWENLGKSGAAWKRAGKELHKGRRGERVLGVLHAGLSELGIWSVGSWMEKRFFSPHAHNTHLPPVPSCLRAHISRSPHVG